MISISFECAHALTLDTNDPLASFRQKFHIPLREDGEPCVYLCGNSLGLQPKSTAQMVTQELEKWARYGVEGHFEEPMPWYNYHEFFSEPVSHIVGAMPQEVVTMGSLTANLHLMMVSFYRPTQTRYKIVIEGGAFPSDRYAVASQARFHGFDPKEAILCLEPREGESTLRMEDIEQVLTAEGDSIALVMLGGVNFYTGQFFDLESITNTAHKIGAFAGFDLAHAAGNLSLQLHDWGVDFAAWCSYKYLNAGPGGVACCFVHERHALAQDIPRFAGWWGNHPSTRFEMPEEFLPQPGAAGWQLSNAPILPMASLQASLQLFVEATMPLLRKKSMDLTGYLYALLEQIPNQPFRVLTPKSETSRGCQLSIQTPSQTDANELSSFLRSSGVICDVRHDVIRAAPVPLYNSFHDVWFFADRLRTFVEQR